MTDTDRYASLTYEVCMPSNVHNATIATYEPGDMTRYRLLFVQGKNWTIITKLRAYGQPCAEGSISLYPATDGRYFVTARDVMPLNHGDEHSAEVLARCIHGALNPGVPYDG